MSDPNAPIFMATMSAGTNIAVIKYWGKADKEFNTPINDSLSVTLDQQDLRAVTTAAASARFDKHRLWLNGEEEESAATNPRFLKCIQGVLALASDKEYNGIKVTKADWQKLKIHISSFNTFPTAAGLASSAAGYAALVASLAELTGAVEEYPGQLTTIARQGSGSACRSLYGGVVAWRQGSADDDWKYSMAEQIRPDWPKLRAIILVVSDAKKDTSSTAGMSTSVATSELLAHRAAEVVPKRMAAIVEACKAEDFQTFGKITMQDSNQFHATCLDTYPPIFYMNDISRTVIRLVTKLNEFYGEIRAAYTFDAGPNAVLYCLDDHVVEVGALMLRYYPAFGDAYVNNVEFYQTIQSFSLDKKLVELCDQTGRQPNAGDVKMMYYTKSGPGPLRVTDICNLDPETGLNTYTKS